MLAKFKGRIDETFDARSPDYVSSLVDIPFEQFSRVYICRHIEPTDAVIQETLPKKVVKIAVSFTDHELTDLNYVPLDASMSYVKYDKKSGEVEYGLSPLRQHSVDTVEQIHSNFLNNLVFDEYFKACPGGVVYYEVPHDLFNYMLIRHLIEDRDNLNGIEHFDENIEVAAIDDWGVNFVKNPTLHRFVAVVKQIEKPEHAVSVNVPNALKLSEYDLQHLEETLISHFSTRQVKAIHLLAEDIKANQGRTNYYPLHSRWVRFKLNNLDY